MSPIFKCHQNWHVALYKWTFILDSRSSALIALALFSKFVQLLVFFYAQNRKTFFQNKFYGLLNNPIIKKTAPEKKTVKDRAIFGVQ